MFGIDERSHTTGLLAFSDDMERYCRFPSSLLTEDFNNPSTGSTPATEDLKV
jgi:hypothetical protein